MSYELYDRLVEHQRQLCECDAAEKRADNLRLRAAKALRPITPATESLDFINALSTSRTPNGQSASDNSEEQFEDSMLVPGAIGAEPSDTITTLRLSNERTQQPLPTPSAEKEAKLPLLPWPASDGRAQSHFAHWRRTTRGKRAC